MTDGKCFAVGIALILIGLIVTVFSLIFGGVHPYLSWLLFVCIFGIFLSIIGLFLIIAGIKGSGEGGEL